MWSSPPVQSTLIINCDLMSHSLLGSRCSEQVLEVERVFISASHGETAFASESSTPLFDCTVKRDILHRR